MAFLADRFVLKLVLTGVLIVIASVAASVFLTSGFISQLTPEEQVEGYMAAVTVPLIIAPIAVSVMALLVLRNHRLLIEVDRLANHDELTGLMNRRSFMRRAQDRLAHPLQGGRAVLALADLDHFKRVNDTHGHAAGDVALRHVADQLAHNAPEGSLVARLGGEEFAILFNWTNVQDVPLAMKAVCDAIAGSPCVPLESGPALHITVSIGVAIAAAQEDIDTLLGRADAAMYAAKHDGRNRTKLAA